MNIKDFFNKNKKTALLQIKNNKVKDLIFSQNTYELKIQDKNNFFWTFLKLDNEAIPTDFFCTCTEYDKKQICIHIAISYFRICQYPEPLHIIFNKSFWNAIFTVYSKKLGYKTNILKKHKNGYYSIKDSTDTFFSIEGLIKHDITTLEEILSTKNVNTEQLSLKFSNINEQDIALWEEEKGSDILNYQLSFWSDLATYLFLLQDMGNNYTLQIISEESTTYPKYIIINFTKHVKIKLYIPKEEIEYIFAHLKNINSPIQIYADDKIIESITYDEQKSSLHIKTTDKIESLLKENANYITFKNSFYIPNKAFIYINPIFKNKKIAFLLNNYSTLLAKYINIEREPISPRYKIYFDEDKNFNIKSYLYSLNDMKLSNFFDPWIYIASKNTFFRINKKNFIGINLKIPHTQISSFISTHINWLNQKKHFQINCESIPSKMHYFIDNEKNLIFQSQLDIQIKDFINLQDYIYIDKKGFFKKENKNDLLPIRHNLKISKNKIASFIKDNKHILEQITGFFSAKNPIKKFSLEIVLEKNIRINKKIKINEEYKLDNLIFFNSYVYVKNKGFHPIIIPQKIKQLKNEITIPKKDEANFLKYELAKLIPYAHYVDKRLLHPEFLKIYINKTYKEGTNTYWLEIFYKSNIGLINIKEIYDNIKNNSKYIFSSAGLIFLKTDRFYWLSQLTPEKWNPQNSFVRINFLDWIKLLSFEYPILLSKNKDDRNLIDELENFEKQKKPSLSLLKANLRPYQKLGIQWLWKLYCNKISALLCDEMGLGKTHQAMALLSSSFIENKSKKFLIICPTSVIYHWEDLLKKFVPAIKSTVFHGFLRNLTNFATNEANILLTSYGIFRLEQESLCSFNYDIAIFDEIQVAKNWLSKTHQSLKKINATMKLGLTGTPLENNISELKAIFDIILPDYFPKDHVFKEFFIHPIEKTNDEEKKRLLSNLIKPFILRRKKSEVLQDLPEKIEEIAYCDLSYEQIDLYNSIIKQSKTEILKEFNDSPKSINYLHIFSILSKLKQICNHPSLIKKDIATYYKHKSGKWELFLELITEALVSNQKIVIFSQYLDMISIIENYFKSKKIGFETIKGSTKNRQKKINKFKKDPKCEVFIASLLAAGVGIDLSCASVVIHYDRWWNPAKENQATDRVHRIGQNRGVQVFKLVTKNTIEEKIHMIIEKKKDIINKTISSDETETIKKLSKEEIISILQEIHLNN